MQEQIIDTTEELSAFCRLLESSAWLALDTEFVREKTYYPQFCLLQISDGEHAACIDPIRIDDLSELRKMIYNPKVTKVFHAGRQDLEIFYQLWDELPSPIFDTQLAATLLGMGDQMGYGNLVKATLNITLEKGHARTDWSRRPLESEQLRYALDDVVYLGDLYLKLREQLQQLEREHWLEEDFNWLSDPKTYEIDPMDTWQRIKGRQHLRGVQLAVLQTLSAWREQEAQQHNRPKRWILKDEVLVDLSKRTPKSLSQMEKIRGLEAGAVKRSGETLLALIAKAKSLPKEQWPTEKRIPKKLSVNQEAQTDLLMASLRLLAEQNNITHTALGTRKELERLVLGERDVDILHGWRAVLAGNALREILDGRLQLSLAEGKLTLQTV